MPFIVDAISALSELVYPRICPACDGPLESGRKDICVTCSVTLPLTDFHLWDDNPVARHFWGRADVTAATALLHFQKDGKVQQLLHQLKYKGRKDIGVLLGKMLGAQLLKHEKLSAISAILPVPLHPQKQLRRGFNQSAVIAGGIAEVLGVPVLENILLRHVPTASQTRKGRLQRWSNVDGKFGLQRTESIAGTHILIVDDVITTGATLEACIQLLHQVQGVKVSVAAVAHAVS